jgi:hypothetical protein
MRTPSRAHRRLEGTAPYRSRLEPVRRTYRRLLTPRLRGAARPNEMAIPLRPLEV